MVVRLGGIGGNRNAARIDGGLPLAELIAGAADDKLRGRVFRICGERFRGAGKRGVDAALLQISFSSRESLRGRAERCGCEQGQK
jgi:hypothetical protein